MSRVWVRAREGKRAPALAISPLGGTTSRRLASDGKKLQASRNDTVSKWSLYRVRSGAIAKPLGSPKRMSRVLRKGRRLPRSAGLRGIWNPPDAGPPRPYLIFGP